MPILGIDVSVTGLVGVAPRIVYIQTNDTEATVLTAGYLNRAVQEGFVFTPTDMAIINTTNNGVNWYQVTHVAPNWSLVANVNPGAVLLPVVLNHIATYTNALGQIGDVAATAIHGGSIQAGLAGTQGSFIAFPAASGGANDKLVLAAVTSGGNFTTTISNRAMGQATTMSFADVGNVAGSFLVAATIAPFTANHSMVASGTGGFVADAGYQLKTVAAAVVAGGAAAQVVMDAFVTAASNIVASWNTTTNPTSILTVTPGVGQFTVTSTIDPGASTLNYIVTKV